MAAIVLFHNLMDLAEEADHFSHFGKTKAEKYFCVHSIEIKSTWTPHTCQFPKDHTQKKITVLPR